MPETFETIVPLEKVGISPSYGCIFALGDDRLMWVWPSGSTRPPLDPLRVNFSSDLGRTWSDPVPLKLENGRELTGVLWPSIVRLPSGHLGLVQTSEFRPGSHRLDRAPVHNFYVSKDEGQSWSDPVQINPSTIHANREDRTVDALLQLSDGRLVLPCSKLIGPTLTAEDPNRCFRFGQEFKNAISYTLCVGFVYYSDDQGQSWQRSENEVFATIDRGLGGIYPMGEPQVAELADGRLLMMAAHCTLGRIFRSYSEDRGQTWQEAQATDLVNRRGPLCLKRIPGTDDLLVIWNQVSPWEAMQGLFRHRLSLAISKDGGLTWAHHKNLESLDDVNYLPPEPLHSYVQGKPVCQPIDRSRYHQAPGPLRSDHPFCAFDKGKAIICYGFGVLGDPDVISKTYGMDIAEVGAKFGFTPNTANPNKVRGVNKVRVVPIEWLYE